MCCSRAHVYDGRCRPARSKSVRERILFSRQVRETLSHSGHSADVQCHTLTHTYSDTHSCVFPSQSAGTRKVHKMEDCDTAMKICRSAIDQSIGLHMRTLRRCLQLSRLGRCHQLLPWPIDPSGKLVNERPAEHSSLISACIMTRNGAPPAPTAANRRPPE